jgi:hypothetical protein
VMRANGPSFRNAPRHVGGMGHFKPTSSRSSHGSRPRITRGSTNMTCDSQLASFADRFPDLLAYPGTANQLSPKGMAHSRGVYRDNVNQLAPRHRWWRRSPAR